MYNINAFLVRFDYIFLIMFALATFDFSFIIFFLNNTVSVFYHRKKIMAIVYSLGIFDSRNTNSSIGFFSTTKFIHCVKKQVQ